MKISLPFMRLLKDRGGNFGIMTAVIAPVALGAAGISIDLTRAMQVKGELQSIADSASLAAARALKEEEGMTTALAKERAEKIYAGQMVNYLKTGKETDAEIDAMIAAQRAALKVTITETPNGSRGNTYSITVSSTYGMPLNAMTGLVAGKTMDLAASSTATSSTESTTGISMYLVLDRSGSMSFETSTVVPNATCVNYNSGNWGNKNVTDRRSKYYIWPEKPCYVRKIDALKTAADGMFAALNKVDVKSNLVRVGAVSYHSAAQPVSPISWGTAKAKQYVSNLPGIPEGGTDANDAMTAAISALKSKDARENGRDKETEAFIHKQKENDDVKRFIVLMTDGEMTGASGGWKDYLDRDVRKKCAAAAADGINIFTVAFMAPDNGKKLLQACATEQSYYYEPENMEELVKAFGEIAEKAAKATTRLTN